MAKERMLTVLVPIKSGDYTIWTGVSAPTLSDFPDLNTIYKYGELYYRKVKDETTGAYSVVNPVDREFPVIGKPLEIFDFTYDATRMGTAPTISAQGIMWYADKDDNGEDVTLEGLWAQECHVTFNGENFYLKQIPTSSKSNEDARYKYDIDFVAERVVLENVYLYDVVQPFVTERPISESASFSFYGDISELAKRINASLLRSGLSTLVMQANVTESDILTYEEWNEIGLGIYTGTKPIRKYIGGSGASPYRYFYPYYGGDYSAYLRGEIYELVDGEFVMSGYQCKIGKDNKGILTTSDEKLITFENNTIHEALQQFHDTFELQYYIYRETDGNGDYTGNTIIMVGDCQYDFADVDGDDYVRDDDGIPTSSAPFDYGVEDALLSKEKANTTDKIITRITGLGSTENIPWYYPNPNADGWIKPVYKTNGVEQSVTINYPTSEGTTVADSIRYEKFLKNRVSDVFQFGKKVLSVSKGQAVDYGTTHPMYIDETSARIGYQFSLSESTRMKVQPFVCDLDGAQVSYTLYKDGRDITSNSNAFMKNGGSGTLAAGDYYILFNISFTSGGPTITPSVSYYYYPSKSAWCDPWKTWSLRMVLNILTGIFSFSAIRTFIASFFGFNASMPAFLSTNPNLRFVDSEDATEVGWYSGSRRISKSEMVFGQTGDSYYVFEGGAGTKTLGVDDCYQATFNTYTESCNLQLLDVDPGNWDDCYLFFTAWSYGDASKRWPSCNIIVEVDVEVAEFIAQYITYSFEGYVADGWYKGNKKQALADWGISNESTLNQSADVFDTIEFQRIKYITPQPRLMPEVYIKTDGERRSYNAHNYYVNGGLLNGTADPMIGEVQSGSKVKNPLYKEKETDADSKHYVFENEYVQNMPHEHIETFDDVKPTIKGQENAIYVLLVSAPADFTTNFSNYYTIDDGEYVALSEAQVFTQGTFYERKTIRIDVVEEFAYDELDNDEVWESNDDGNISGEYKHPYFFAKLRPLGFNLFDLALQDDMVLSMTTGHCGACNFKIGVDENTGKNPVQIWKYDVYGGSTYATRGILLYAAGSLRRHIDTSSLYYDTDGTADGYTLVDTVSTALDGFLVDSVSDSRAASFERTTYSAQAVMNGEVGSLKQSGKKHFEGDIAANGSFIDTQQDTSENYVWVALMKDTDTYGVLMPSARPDYGDDNYSVYIRPQSVTDVHIDEDAVNDIEESTDEEDEENADKFVLTNIRLPQVYLHRAERDLSRKIIAYMYDNNYQKFNFSIKFSRIFLAQNTDIDDNLNENSVLYVSFNKKTYRQYVKHYTYKMSHDAVLPEISVDMNEELNVTRTNIEQMAALSQRQVTTAGRRVRDEIAQMEMRINRRTVARSGDTVITGNFVSRTAGTSISELQKVSQGNASDIFDTVVDMKTNHFKRSDFQVLNGTDLKIGDEVFLPTSFKRGGRLIKRKWDATLEKFIEDNDETFAPAFIDNSATLRKLVDYGYVQLSDVTAPTFEAGVYFELSNGVYTPLDEEPTDWNTDWTSYYKEATHEIVTPTPNSTFTQLVSAVNVFNENVADRIMQIRYTMEERLGLTTDGNCSSLDLTRDQITYDYSLSSGTAFWKSASGNDISTTSTCPPPFLISWTPFIQ